MKEFYGKQILTELTEFIAPEHTALLLVDFQNDFCKTKSPSGKETLLYPSLESTLDNTRNLLNEARRLGILIVYIQHTTLPKFQNESPARISMFMHARKLINPYDLTMFTLDGSWGWKVVTELEFSSLNPSDQILRIKKYRGSAFIGTNLDLLLRNSEIKTLLMTGVLTEGCVESTARDALHFDYFMIHVSDCVDSHDKDDHKSSLRHAAKGHPVIPSSEIIRLWQEK